MLPLMLQLSVMFSDYKKQPHTFLAPGKIPELVPIILSIFLWVIYLFLGVKGIYLKQMGKIKLAIKLRKVACICLAFATLNVIVAIPI